MVNGFLRVVQTFKSDPFVRFAFEWPRYSDGWRSKEVSTLAKFLPYSAEFDGCAYGTSNARGELIKKPWRVITDWRRFREGLNRRCDRRHVHGQGRGLDIRNTQNYTKVLARRIVALLRPVRHACPADIAQPMEVDGNGGASEPLYSRSSSTRTTTSRWCHHLLLLMRDLSLPRSGRSWRPPCGTCTPTSATRPTGRWPGRFV